jgi:integrase
VRPVIASALTPCAVCKQVESEHGENGHTFKLDTSIPRWHGWHAFRRGLATNLHALGLDDKTIQTILRHSNVDLTMNVYVNSVRESRVSAMDVLSKNARHLQRPAREG